jgi:hypothetical protein
VCDGSFAGKERAKVSPPEITSLPFLNLKFFRPSFQKDQKAEGKVRVNTHPEKVLGDVRTPKDPMVKS